MPILTRGRLLAIVMAIGAAFAEPSRGSTFAILDSQPGDFVGGGERRTLTPDDGAFYGSLIDSTAGLTISGPQVRVTFDFVAPLASTLVNGLYENATENASARRPGLRVAVGSRSCNTISGRFVIFDIAVDTSGVLTRLAANFEQHCEGAPPALVGIVRFNSDVPPDAVEPTPVPATPTPTSYDVFFSYESQPGDPVGGGVTDFVSDGDALFDVALNDDRVFVNISADDFWTAHFATPRGTSFGPGTYEDAKSFLDRSPDEPGLEVSSRLGWCPHARGRFVVLDVAYDDGDAVTRLAIDFEQYCHDEDSPALFGSLRFHSTVPIGTAQPTSTATPTPSATPTETNTSLVPLTPTPSSTASKTLTPSLTPTPTFTPIRTPTPTARPCVDADIGHQLPARYFGFSIEVSNQHHASCAAQPFVQRVFRFTAPRDGYYIFDTFGAANDTVLFARAGDCDGEELACNDDADESAGTSRLILSLAAGSSTVVFVGTTSETSAFQLNVAREGDVPCIGDCDGNARVAINDLILLVGVALGDNAPTVCAASAGGTVDIPMLIQAVNHAISGCPMITEVAANGRWRSAPDGR